MADRDVGSSGSALGSDARARASSWGDFENSFNSVREEGGGSHTTDMLTMATTHRTVPFRDS